VIDLTDDSTLARQLTKKLGGKNGSAAAIDLEALQDARRRRLDQRRSTITADADCIDCEDEAATDLLHEQRAGISDFLGQRAKALTVSEIWHNPASKPGGHLYERFFTAWASAPSKKLRLVFHGTPEANVEAICRDGLDPTKRSGQVYGKGEYFGGDATVSLGYCRGGRKMIVFVVLLDPSGVTMEGMTQAGEMVVINKPEFQLPLAVITFSQKQPAHAPAMARGYMPYGAVVPGGMPLPAGFMQHAHQHLQRVLAGRLARKSIPKPKKRARTRR